MGNYTVTTIIQMQGSRRLAKAQVHNTTAQQTVIFQTVHIFLLHALVTTLLRTIGNGSTSPLGAITGALLALVAVVTVWIIRCV